MVTSIIYKNYKQDDEVFKTSLRALLCGAVLALCPMVCNAADGDKFKLVKSVSELNDGDKIILVKLNADSQGTTVALSTKSKFGQYIEGAKIEVNGDIATANNTTEIIQIEKESNDFYLKCQSNNQYLCNNNDVYGNNTIGFSGKKTPTTGSKGKVVVNAAIEIDEVNNYNAIISYEKLKSKLMKMMIGYNDQTSSKYGQFRCYTLMSIETTMLVPLKSSSKSPTKYPCPNQPTTPPLYLPITARQ